jgi:hypothetical protein
MVQFLTYPAASIYFGLFLASEDDNKEVQRKEIKMPQPLNNNAMVHNGFYIWWAEI